MDALLKGNVVSGGVSCNQIPQDGLVASYLLQGTAEDETGTYDGTETSMAYAYDDERGVVSSFNGTTSRMTVNVPKTSVSLWLNTTVATDAFVLTALEATNNLHFTLSTVLSGDFGFNSFNSDIWGVASSSINDGNWHHVYIEFSTTRSGLKISIDGVNQTLAQVLGTTPTTGLLNGNLLYIGNRSTDFKALSGNLSNIHVYNRALTATEVTDIYNIEKYQHNNALDESLIAYYPLDGNSLDNGLNQNDGTDTSMTYPSDIDLGVVGLWNGTTSSVLLPNSSLDFTGGIYTLVLWFKTSDASATDRFLVANRYGTHTFYIALNNSVLKFGTWGVSTTLTGVLTGLNDGNWHQIVVKVNNTSIASYIDTINDTGASGTVAYANQTLANGCQFGNWDLDNSYVFNGNMCGIRFYDGRILSDKEIDWLYDYEKPNSTECIENSTIDNPDPFEDGSGIALYKLDGNANDTTGDYDGTATSVIYADGVFGQTAVFNGISSQISKSATTGATSMSFWTTAPIEDYAFGSGGLFGDGVSVGVSAGRISSNFANETFQIFEHPNHYAYITDIISGTEPKHIVINYIADNDYEVYIDNVSRTISYYGTVTNLIDNITKMGLALTDGWCAYNIEQVRFFDRTITADEVTKLYNERTV